jgi:hypothetical protein
MLAKFILPIAGVLAVVLGQTLPVSEDGLCGANSDVGATCEGSEFGDWYAFACST